MGTSNPKTPEVLWHYTSMDGFLGIWTSRALWASHLSFLNDASENRRLKELLLPLLLAAGDREYAAFNAWMASLKVKNQAAMDLFTPIFKQRFGELLETVKDAVRTYSQSEIFVTCFSEAADSLSQWRAYGSAYAIGFDPESLLSMRDMTSEDTHAGNPAGMPFFDSVKYVSETDHHTLNGILNSAIWNLYTITTTAMYGVINAVAPFIKDAAFESEKEWRLCCRTPVFDEPVMFRAARSHIVPYIQIPLELR